MGLDCCHGEIKDTYEYFQLSNDPREQLKEDVRRKVSRKGEQQEDEQEGESGILG